MKNKILSTIAAMACPALMMAQGWPSQYDGVILQGFYWNSYDATNWKNLESQADELSQYFNLIWIPQSGNCGHNSMGYDDLYWFNNYNSSFGNEQELRSMITTFKQKGLGTIADVVINHRSGVTNLVDFPAETYKGKTYQLLSTDICKDDDSGATAVWAKANGYQLSDNNDTGEDANFARDLDHNSLNVQENVKAYLDFLLNDLGYSGVRYDMVKGYAPKFTGIYNDATKPQFSIGEYFDGDKQKVLNWLNGTKVNNIIQSAAFDFPIRYAVRDAANSGDWTKLDNGGIATDNNYSRYAITFTENHDTEKREDAQQDPIKKDTLAANAYIIAMPGTPCVFLKHWTEYKEDIKNMILLRNFAGINNESQWQRNGSTTGRYVFTTTGTHGKLHVAVGTSANNYYADERIWAIATEGKGYRYFMEKSEETVWPSLPSGEYFDTPKVILRAISASNNAKIVYTIDGSTPTASSNMVDNGSIIQIPEGDITLKAALLIDGNISGMTERHYDVKSFKPYDITVNVNADEVNWTSMNVWSWGGDGSHSPAASLWPGDNVTTTNEIGGKVWYTMTYKMNTKDDYVNLVFSSMKGEEQTVDIQNIRRSSFIEILPEKDSKGHFQTSDVTSQYTTSINAIKLGSSKAPHKIMSIEGRTVRVLQPGMNEQKALEGLPDGIYIIAGKKISK